MPKINPDNQTIPEKVNRGRELSRENDSVKSKHVNLLDIDSALHYYFENVIKPDVMEGGERVKVPLIYANPERFVALQRQGFLRDTKRKIIVPAIAFRRTSIQKDETIPVDKLDPQQPKIFQTYQANYTRENRYDKLTATKGISPKREMYAVSVPDYVILNYDFIIWTSFTDQMNSIVERINWAEGSYWGEPGKFRFRATIDSFEDNSEYESNRRNIKTNFSVTLRGYLLPEQFNPVNTEKFITPKQLVVTNETDIDVLPITDIDADGAQSIRVIQSTGGSGGGSGGAATSLGNPITLTSGNNIDFTDVSFDGSQAVTVDIATTSTPSFDNVTVGQYITHADDADTQINFLDDEIRFEAGNLLLFDIHKKGSAPHEVTVNGGSNNVDFVVKDNDNDILFRTDADADNVLFPDAVKVSGSATSTGSFGRLETPGHISASGEITSNVVNVKTRVKAIGSSLEFAGNTLDFVDGSSTSRLFKGTAAGTFEAYHAGNKKFETAAGGINVTGNVTASGHISGSSASTASFGTYMGDGSQLTGISSGIFRETGSIHSTTNNLAITGSVDIKGNLTAQQYIVSSSVTHMTTSFSSGSTMFGDTSDDTHRFTGSIRVAAATTQSTAIFADNVQNGYPTSNNWGSNLEGSYFNNFDNTTHVSEILRFMSGVLSHSLDVADASANTKTFASVDTNDNNRGSTANQIAGRVPQNYAALGNAALDYLVSKGWTSVGAKIFDGISIYNNSDYFIDFDSNSGGSTTISSSADSELFGLGGLTSGAATEFKVRVHATQSFSDNSTNTSPNKTSNTFTTESVLDLSTTSFGSSNGLTLAKINTSQPAVIPAAFQDGKFENVGGSSQMSGSLSRKYHASKTDFTSISSSGYYNFHDLKVGIATGSGNFQFVNGTNKNYFYAPRSVINTAIGTNSLSDTGTTHKALTATSRSLSGAPYLIDATYEVSTKITGLFSPLYAGTTTLVDMTTNSVGVGSVSISGDTISTNGGTIQTAGKVFQSDGTTAVNSGVPRHDDIAIVTASVSYDSGTSDNIQQSSTFTDTSFQVLVKARNRDSDQSTLDTQNISYHVAGAFGQPAASGSLGIYGRAQGYDGGDLDGTTEQFSGEDFRIQLNNNVTSFAGDAFTTTFQVGGILSDYDLQVKPGFLVDPGGTYRYWYPSSYGSGTYKYYIRRFQTSGTKTSMTVNVGQTLVNWNSTSNGIAVGLILKSGTSAGGNTSISTCRIFDPSATTSNLIEAGVSNDNHKNPFSSNIDLYGNTGGSVASTTYTVPIRNADGMYIDSTDNELYVIIRYKGDPTPVTSLTLSFS